MTVDPAADAVVPTTARELRARDVVLDDTGAPAYTVIGVFIPGDLTRAMGRVIVWGAPPGDEPRQIHLRGDDPLTVRRQGR